jgi:hypothetical protein
LNSLRFQLAQKLCVTPKRCGKFRFWQSFIHRAKNPEEVKLDKMILFGRGE